MEFEEKKNTAIYWDDVPIFCHPEEFKLGIREMNGDDVVEIDTLEELAVQDLGYLPLLEKQP